jgi:hypothetical protein
VNLDESKRAAEAVTKIDDVLTEIFLRNFGVSKTATEGHNAYALAAVEVALSLANIFLSIKNPQEHRNYRAICDTTYHLNTNLFWEKNASVLLPIMHVCLNTYRDGVELKVERTTRNEYSSNDALISASMAAPLELFPVIAYLIGGPALMLKSSLQLKKDLAPYFLG